MTASSGNDRTAPAAAAPWAPSAVPLPDFTGVEVRALAAQGSHPVLGEVAALLLRNWPSEEDAVAYYEDSAAAPGH
ncbi:YxD-tail cyclophane-containing RiPP peptide [Streptomyces sp. NPDC101150]|uniref:YxD-tail cyclophane-containing RiPP peptide n=1 Tax=Streptomyces sp. NPDC101150 TaxID=3366114 RepID=UPI0038125FEE